VTRGQRRQAGGGWWRLTSWCRLITQSESYF
jgi:hypothetical protein